MIVNHPHLKMGRKAVTICRLYLQVSHPINHGSKMFGGKSNVAADVYYVVRPAMVASTLDMCRLFFLLFSKQHNITTTYIAFMLYRYSK